MKGYRWILSLTCFPFLKVQHAVVIEFVQIKLVYSSMHESRDVKKHAQLVTVLLLYLGKHNVWA